MLRIDHHHYFHHEHDDRVTAKLDEVLTRLRALQASHDAVLRDMATRLKVSADGLATDVKAAETARTQP